MFNSKKAFTLLELLVVVGLLSIIISFLAVSYSSSQRKARDTKRKSDLQAINSSLEQYYTVCGYQYPSSLGTSINCAAITPTIMIMATIPVDPRTTTPYPFVTVAGGSYQLCTYSLEAAVPTGYCLQGQQ